MWTLFAAGSMLLSSAQAAGGDLQVTIVGRDTQPLPEAELALYAVLPLGSRTADPVVRGRTDAQGRFTFHGLASVRHLMIVDRDGYRTRTISRIHPSKNHAVSQHIEISRVDEPAPTQKGTEVLTREFLQQIKGHCVDIPPELSHRPCY